MQKHKITVSDVLTLGKAAKAIIGWVKRESWKCSVLILMLVVGKVFMDLQMLILKSKNQGTSLAK